MSPMIRHFGLDSLTTDERIVLAQELWDSVGGEIEAAPISPELAAELDRRIALADADPGRGKPWEEVLAATRARWGK